MSPGRHLGRSALLAVPLVAVVAIAILATGVVGTLSQFTASITNPNNRTQSASVGLTETDEGGDVCTAPGDGQWRDCPTIDKFGGGSLTSGATTTTTVTLENTGNAPAQLFLLPSQCSDTLTGARGALCGQVTVAVSCAGTTVVTPRTLNAFHDARNFPTGYPVGTVAAGAGATCSFTLTTGTVSAPGAVSQPISWRLTSA